MTETKQLPPWKKRKQEIDSFLKKHDLNAKELDILRGAARKYVDAIPNGPAPKLHDGSINMFTNTPISNLFSKGLLVEEYLVKENREMLKERAEGLIRYALNKEVRPDPFEYSDGAPNWARTLRDLEDAETTINLLEKKTIRITVVGRKIAAEWKRILGATEP